MERKVVLITGGAMCHGKSHARKFAENGFDVVLADMQDPEGWLPEGWKSSEEQAKVLNTKNYNFSYRTEPDRSGRNDSRSLRKHNDACEHVRTYRLRLYLRQA